MSRWSMNTAIRECRYLGGDMTKNTNLTMNIMSKGPKYKTLIAEAKKKVKEIGNTEI